MKPKATHSIRSIMMRPCAILFAVLALLSPAASLQAQTLDWGNDVFGDVVDSNGLALDNTFVFEIGAFDAGFTPMESNIADWVSHWNVFDRAQFNASAGYFASSVDMLPDGRSNSIYLSAGSGSFEGLNAYLFVRKGDLPVPMSEWLLVRATSWVFPDADDCCPGELSIEWALSDVGSGQPVFGSQNGFSGLGVVGNPGVHDLQTYTFVPEPGMALLALLGLLLVSVHRRRI